MRKRSLLQFIEVVTKIDVRLSQDVTDDLLVHALGPTDALGPRRFLLARGGLLVRVGLDVRN